MVSFNSVLPTQAAGLSAPKQQAPQVDAGIAAALNALTNLSGKTGVKMNSAASLALQNTVKVFEGMKDPVVKGAVYSHLSRNA